MMKKQLLKWTIVGFCSVLGVTALGAGQVSAHGYITSPGSRAYLGSNAFTNDTGQKPLNTNVGQVQYEPQSIEAPKNTFIDGKLASANISSFSNLDEQTSTRWHQNQVKSGALTIKWHLTAQHKTSTWDYYLTRPGWNPNQPLSILNFEKITSIDDQGKLPAKDVAQTINIPTDRSGYNVLLGVWNISDTANAFYQAVDLNITK
ncbi:hypothetical protein C5L17_000889 [Latilactobacillus sakei subsp. sakei]|nr:chitin-binding protein [Latilactobacillus sakei]EOR84892.1 chitin binding protein [Latilactobacillus sakei subsp. sakei LS25]TDG57097.1 hypothetical protein C5L17_000889 [Latilactobacillus sakei subsp. sakei]USF96304.1 chitin-binding protein [Latilactobacillus sakei]USG00084.1 chitin-binding protein [Latilactobacillus sakei subsp. sakei]